MMKKKRVIVLALVLIVGVVAACKITVVVVTVRKFEQKTGLDIPLSAKILSSADSHGGFLGDGEFYIVFQVQEDVIKEYLSGSPPWDRPEWMEGPIEPVIGFHCSFGYTHLGRSSEMGGPWVYSGDSPVLRDLYESERIYYSARRRGPADRPWHNGDLLIIDPRNNRIWYSEWDF